MPLRSPARTLAIGAALIFLVAAPGPARAQAPPPPVFAAWLTGLANAGYGVSQGLAVANNASVCAAIWLPVFNTCFENDPNDPYISPLVPVGAGYVDPAFGQVEAQTLASGAQAGQVFRLSGSEAELAIITLPPLAAYFSYQSYVFSRLSSDYKKGTKAASPDPARGILFASLNSSINNIDIARQSGLGFSQGTIAIITTANPAMVSDLTSQFVAAGGDPSLIFVDSLGANLYPGLDATADDFMNLIRYLAPADPVAGAAWQQDPADNVLIYRLDQPPGAPLATYPTPSLATKSFNSNEAPFAADVAELSQLMKAWLATQETKASIVIKPAATSQTVTPAGVMTKGSVGPLCIGNGSDCSGDEQDTDAYRQASAGKQPANRLFVVDGVDHALTGNASVYSLSLVDAPLGEGAIGIAQANPAVTGVSFLRLTGSAVAALQTLGLWGQASPQLQADAPFLYLQIFTRGCTTQTYCNQPFTTLVPTTAIPYSDAITVEERAYLLPGYCNGANPDDLVTPNLIN